LLLWASSLIATFALGFNVAPRTPPAKQVVGTVNGIVKFDNVHSLAAVVADQDKDDSDSRSMYDVYEESFKSARYIDLTHPFSPKSPVWAGFGQASVKPSVAGSDMPGFIKVGEEFTYKEHGFVATSYALTTDQYGTQLDPPAHWNEFGATISDLPPTFAVRPLVVINVASKVAKDPKYAATVEDIDEWEKSHGHVPEGSVVFFRSDWSKKWGTMQEPSAWNDWGKKWVFPGVKLETLKMLHLQRKILFHGHEPLDTDMTPTLEGEAWLMHNDFAQAEGVANLEGVPESGCLLSIGFAKAQGGSGGYARYIAICPPDSTSAGTTIEENPGAPLPKQQHPLRRNADGVLAPDADASVTEYCSIKSALGCSGVNEPIWNN
jgi:kynurenine formamidase